MADDQVKNPWLRDRYAEMLRDRFQGTVRAQTRYLFLLLLISAYTLGVHFTPGDVVEVPFLGLKVPRQLVEAFAVSTLGILMLALFGTAEALKRVLVILPAVFGVADRTLPPEVVEAEPMLMDFLAYCTFVSGEPTRITRIGRLVLFPLPLLAILAWATWLWWIGVHRCLRAWPWLVVIHVVNALILAGALVRLIIFVWGMWQGSKPPRATTGA
jgi:hypothetical protein